MWRTSPFAPLDRRLLRAAVAAALVIVALLVAACGGGGDDDGATTAASGGERPALIVSAAASLTHPFERYGRAFEPARVRLSFAGSDELAAQIRQGVAPDVFASANTTLPADLHDEGLVEEPVAFATNALVLAVPADGDGAVASLEDLTKPGTTIAIGSETVPIGAYTRAVLGRLGDAQADAILANVRSTEPDVSGIVGKLSQGAVDAGFVYATDVAATNGALRAIPLPDRLQPVVAYAAAVVRGARQPALARAFVDGLLSGEGAAALRDAGFGPPPASTG